MQHACSPAPQVAVALPVVQETVHVSALIMLDASISDVAAVILINVLINGRAKCTNWGFECVPVRCQGAALGILIAGIIALFKAFASTSGMDIFLCVLAAVVAFGSVVWLYFTKKF